MFFWVVCGCFKIIFGYLHGVVLLYKGIVMWKREGSGILKKWLGAEEVI